MRSFILSYRYDKQYKCIRSCNLNKNSLVTDWFFCGYLFVMWKTSLRVFTHETYVDSRFCSYKLQCETKVPWTSEDVRELCFLGIRTEKCWRRGINWAIVLRRLYYLKGKWAVRQKTTCKFLCPEQHLNPWPQGAKLQARTDMISIYRDRSDATSAVFRISQQRAVINNFRTEAYKCPRVFSTQATLHDFAQKHWKSNYPTSFSSVFMKLPVVYVASHRHYIYIYIWFLLLLMLTRKSKFYSELSVS